MIILYKVVIAWATVAKLRRLFMFVYIRLVVYELSIKINLIKQLSRIG